MRTRILQRETFVAKPIQEVFNFFSKTENLILITPAHLNFKIATPGPILMAKGTMIDYKLKLYGIPFKWKTEITAWQAPFTFTDKQLKGPYLKWIHQHQFEEREGGTLMTDRVEYAIPGWIIEPLIYTFFIKGNIDAIFNFREKSVTEIFK